MPATTIVRADGLSGLGAHLARPVGEGPWPGVVVLHEAFGLTDDIREVAGRFAAAGYLALAPDLYSDGGPRRCLVGTFKALAAGKGKAFGDIDAARAFLGLGPLGPVLRVVGVGYHQPSAEDGWRRILAFLDQHLAG